MIALLENEFVMTILSIMSVKFSSIYYIVISGVVGIVMYIVHHNYK